NPPPWAADATGSPRAAADLCYTTEDQVLVWVAEGAVRTERINGQLNVWLDDVWINVVFAGRNARDDHANQVLAQWHLERPLFVMLKDDDGGAATEGDG